MRAIQKNTDIVDKLISSCLRFSVVPIVSIGGIIAFGIEVDSIYDYILEISRLYTVLCMHSFMLKFVRNRSIIIGMRFAIINGFYDAMTEILIIEQLIAVPFPFMDALLDEMLLLAAYGFVLHGLLHYFKTVSELSLLDELTKCYSRRALDLIPTETYQLFYLDLDNFKTINDTFGHHEGDRVLIHFGRLLNQCCGDHGFPVRLGGDEFIALVKPEYATLTIEKLSKACITEQIQFSYGTSQVFDNDFKAALMEADAHLYEMKRERKAVMGAI